MDIVFLGNNKYDFNRVYDRRVLEKMGLEGICISENELEENSDKLKEAKYVFSTWGMLSLRDEQIKKYMPNLQAVFYAAGTVGYFAEPFLKSGVRVFSAAYANGIPVAEYTVSQILLGTKGFYQAAKYYRRNLSLARSRGNNVQGNYLAKVGLIGIGVIGSMVAEKLKEYDIKVYAYDKFIPKERAEELGVELTDLETLFRECDVISNHLANKKELNDILNYDLFKLMKTNAVFINTGRGAQVNEKDLAKALKDEPARTAVLDVQKNESKPMRGPLWWRRNAILTPHIAGSTGNEVTRMADYMIDQYHIFLEGGKPESEVTLEKLKTMA